jgi:hypothetical protein
LSKSREAGCDQQRLQDKCVECVGDAPGYGDSILDRAMDG